MTIETILNSKVNRTSNVTSRMTPEEAAIRAHDITVCLERTSVPEFEELSLLGRGVKLALHLRVAREIDPGRRDHLALVLEASGIFAVGLARCVGIVFKQFLQPASASQLDDALKPLIWGGRTQYKFISKMRSDWFASKGGVANEGAELALPEWEMFRELVREMLEHPALSFEVPQLLREAAGSVIRNGGFLPSANKKQLLLLKYSMLTAKYLCRAGRLPADSERELTTLFVRRQSDLVHAPDDVPNRDSSGSNDTQTIKVTRGSQIELPVEIGSGSTT